MLISSLFHATFPKQKRKDIVVQPCGTRLSRSASMTLKVDLDYRSAKESVGVHVILNIFLFVIWPLNKPLANPQTFGPTFNMTFQ